MATDQGTAVADDKEWKDYSPPTQSSGSDWQDYAAKTPTNAQPPSQQTGPATSIGPDKRGILQKLNDWYVRQGSTYGGTLGREGRSPRDVATEVGKAATAGSIPLLAGSAIAAPVATTLGLAGGAGGAIAGSYLGGKAGEEAGAPELGSDIGGLAGGFFGGMAGSKISGPATKAAANLLRYPATARQSQLGRPGTIKPVLPSMLQKYTIPDWAVPKGEVGTPTNPGPFMEIPAKMPKSVAAEVPPKPSPFSGATSSATTSGTAPLPEVKTMTPPTKFPVVKTRAQVAAEAEPKLVRLDAAPNEGRPATWEDPVVQRLAPLGDPDAIAQVRNRMKGTDPLNPGRIPLKYNTMETTPRSITKVGPNGEITEEPVAPRGNGEPGGIPVLQPPIVRPTPSARSLGRPIIARGPEIPQLNFEKAIPVPSEGQVAPMQPQNVGAPTEQVAPMAPVERRGSVRDLTGPDFMRTARMNDLRAKSAAGDELAKAQLADMQANPFERHEGPDINQVKAMNKPTMTREEAEANTASRAEGRNSRFRLDDLTPAQRHKAITSGMFKGEKLTPQEIEELKK